MTHLLGVGYLNQLLFFVTLYLLHINDFNGLRRNTDIGWKISAEQFTHKKTDDRRFKNICKLLRLVSSHHMQNRKRI